MINLRTPMFPVCSCTFQGFRLFLEMFPSLHFQNFKFRFKIDASLSIRPVCELFGERRCFQNQADFYPCTEFLMKFRPNRRKSSIKETMNYNVTHDTCRY